MKGLVKGVRKMCYFLSLKMFDIPWNAYTILMCNNFSNYHIKTPICKKTIFSIISNIIIIYLACKCISNSCCKYKSNVSFSTLEYANAYVHLYKHHGYPKSARIFCFLPFTNIAILEYPISVWINCKVHLGCHHIHHNTIYTVKNNLWIYIHNYIHT